jgi:hypothetical protein
MSCWPTTPPSWLWVPVRAARRPPADGIAGNGFGWTAPPRPRSYLRHYLQAIAASTAGTPTLKTLIDAAGIERLTANAYDALLERLLVTERIPPGHPTG